MAASATCFEQYVWVIDPANPATTVVGGSSGSVGGGGQRLTSKTQDGSVRSYGTGRQRSVSGPATVNTYNLALIHITVAQLLQLETWMKAGTVLLFRDTYGQRAFGTLFTLSEYFEPMTVATSAPAAAQYGSYGANGPYVDVALVVNEVTMPAGT
jgi:hypothetical protein